MKPELLIEKLYKLEARLTALHHATDTNDMKWVRDWIHGLENGTGTKYSAHKVAIWFDESVMRKANEIWKRYKP